MSDTIIDLPKVAAMLDNGWRVSLYRNQIGSYTARGEHSNEDVWLRARNVWCGALCDAGNDETAIGAMVSEDWNEEGVIYTDDFTPEQALTRLAYKVHGEVI